MTKKFFFSAICAIVVCIATSCGGSQSTSSSREGGTAGKGLFVEVMTLVNEYQGKDDALSEKIQAAGEVLNPISVNITLAEKSYDEASIAKIVFVPESEWQQSLNK